MTQIQVGASCRIQTTGRKSLRGTYAGQFAPASGLPTTGTGVNGAILKSDFWDASATGSIAGLSPFTDFEIGDLIIANKNGASVVADFFGNKASGSGGGGDLLAANNLSDVANAATARNNLGIQKVLVSACSDETTALTAGTGKITFRMPYAMTVTAVRASLTTAQTSGSIFTVDINDGGTTILSTKITIDNTEKTSTTAAAPPVISDTALADDAEITIDIDQIGDGTAKGLKVTLIGNG